MNDYEFENNQIKELMGKYQFAKQVLETNLNILIQDFANRHGYNPVEHIKGRIKSLDSVEEKLQKLEKKYTAKNISRHIKDVVGIRIVVSFLPDIFDIIYLIEHSKNILIIERKDYISVPKNTGYSSYHLIVLVPVCLNDHIEYIECEIQIRTMAMDFWASLDHKIAYKFQESIPEDIKLQMKDYAETIQELDRKMMNLNSAVIAYKMNL